MPGLQGNRVPGSQAARAAGPQDLSGAVRQVRRQGLGSGRQLKRPNQPCWRSGSSLERFQAKWTPVRVKKTRQIKNLEPRFDSIETEKALVCLSALTRHVALSSASLRLLIRPLAGWLANEARHGAPGPFLANNQGGYSPLQ